MELTFIGVIFVPLAIILLFLDIKYLFIATFISSTFTATGVVKLTSLEESIAAFYLFGGMFILKTLHLIIRKKYKFKIKTIANSLGFFVLVCGISIIYPLFFSKGVLVHRPSGIQESLFFSLQNITQFMYLLFAYLIYICTVTYYKNSKVDEERTINLFRIAMIIVIGLGIIQMIIPNEIFDMVFRDNYGMIYSNYRMSSVNNEASFFALFITPMMGFFLINYIFKREIIDLIIVIVTLILIKFHGSSSFILGSLTIVGCFFIYGVINYKQVLAKFRNRNKKKDWIIYISMGICIVSTLLLKDYLIMFIGKLLGTGESGSIRTKMFMENIKIFYKFFITGVGFGSVRSTDLLSTWLVSIGLLGVIPYINYNIKILKKLYFKVERTTSFKYIVLIIVTNIIMFVSVSEPFYGYIWIWYGTVAYLISKKNNNSEKACISNV